MSKNVLWYSELGMHDVEIVGGKNASLGEMIRNLAASGVKVPNGYATTAAAYREFLKHENLDQRINAMLSKLDVDDVQALAATGKEIRQACVKGAKFGFPLVDVKTTLLDGKSHEVDSSADTFKLAAIESFRDAQHSAGLVILEPIMNVVVHAPAQYQGALAGDINRRRGEILQQTSSTRHEIPRGRQGGM